MRLTRHHGHVRTIFDLLGQDEVSATAALGYALSRSPRFVDLLLRECLGLSPVSLEECEIRLEERYTDLERTDIEISVPGLAFLIVEAKLGGDLPSREQLLKYLPRFDDQPKPAGILVVSNRGADSAVRDLGRIRLPLPDGVGLAYRSWRQLHSMTHDAASSEKHAPKRVLRQLGDYLERIAGMDQRYSNMTYVVSLSSTTPDGWDMSWIDIVEKRRKYFYSAETRHWPAEPPNYIAFRYRGKVQSVHHVTDWDFFADPHDVFPEIPSQPWGRHWLLDLGPPIRPGKDIRTGPRVHRSARVWCMLDTLFTNDTVSDALTETERRKALE